MSAARIPRGAISLGAGGVFRPRLVAVAIGLVALTASALCSASTVTDLAPERMASVAGSGLLGQPSQRVQSLIDSGDVPRRDQARGKVLVNPGAAS